jgi:hypothetical protein
MSFIINAVLILFLLSGCGTVKKEVKEASEKGIDALEVAKYKLLPKKEEPKKKILITPFVCAWNPSSDYGVKVSFKFAQKLKKVPGNHLVYFPKNPSAWKVKGSIPRLGIINDPDMVEDARKLHMNYLVTGILDVMRVERRTNGVWPFRHFDQVFEAVLVINVIDTITNALVESHMASAKFAIPLKKIPKDKERLFRNVLKNTVPVLIRNQTKLVAKVVENDQWKGEIIEVEDNPGTVKISAGRDVGIKKGMILSAYDWGKEIKTVNGHSFRCFGEKIGDIKIVSVNKDFSVAVPLHKADYRAGLPVVLPAEE